ncbi:MAG: adenylate/guanylate cyclase domain-containing protein [Acidobacteriota bacterium]
MRKVLAGVLLGVGAAAVILVLGSGGFLETAELKLYDWRMRLAAAPASVNRNIVLVEINDSTIRDMEPIFGHWPWPRVAMSYVIDYLRRAPAKVVAVDITLAERDRVAQYDIGGETWSGEESDKALADSVKQSGNVIMLADAVSEGLLGAAPAAAPAVADSGYRLGDLAEPRPVMLPPYPGLAEASAALGHNFLVLDRDGPARRMSPFVRQGDWTLPSLGVAAALMAAGIRPGEVAAEGDAIRLRDRWLPLVDSLYVDAYNPAQQRRQWAALINYRAPALLRNGDRPYPSYSFRRLFMSEQQLLAGERPMIDPAEFKDRIVFIGFTASGLVDVFSSPFGDDRMPGIQLHASLTDSILAGRFIAPSSDRSRIATVFIVAVAIGLLAAFLRLSAAAAAAAAILAGWSWFALSAFRGGSWLNMVQPLAAGAVALFAGTAYQYFVEDREKRKMKRLFGRYVSRDVYAQLTAHPELAELGGARREMTVLFSDIRGFTTVTEKGNPEELVAQLNEYFSRMVDIVFRHHGTVDKFVGDMVMALFGAPLDDPDHAEHAVQAAVDMVRELGELNRSWAGRGMTQLDIGVGINSGEMIAGNIGSSSIMSYTVIGDNVNLGSRLESLNKDYKTRIIMSDATRTRLRNPYDTRPLGEVKVKGKSLAVTIHEIRVPAPLVTSEEQST